MEKKALKSWDENANEWIKIIDSEEIPSRIVTNSAIIELLSQLPSTTILDCGCGEGWLTRSMTLIGKKSVGIDATLKLIEHARTKGPETYYQMSYDEISQGEEIPESPFEAVIFNFCLYQQEGMDLLLKNLRKSVTTKGYLVIQTIHPFFLLDRKLGYKSQWIANAWEGLPGNFTNGHKWFARTFEDWSVVFSESGLELIKIKETRTNENTPLSVIFILQYKL